MLPASLLGVLYKHAISSVRAAGVELNSSLPIVVSWQTSVERKTKYGLI